MAARENGYSPVKSFFMTPDQLAEHDRRVRERSAGPPIKKWQRSMTLEQYLQAVREGRSRADIVLKHFNNDPLELRKQLKDWEITEGEAAMLAQTEVKKEDYMRLRLNGEKRSQALKTLGLSGAKGYALLNEWGIREMDAEERELDLMAPGRPASKVDQRVAEQIEQKTEARGLVAFNEQQEEQAGSAVLERMEKRAAERERELAELQAAVALWKHEAERKDEQIADLQVEIENMHAAVRLAENEQKRAAAVDHDMIRILNREKAILLQTIEQAAEEEDGYIGLRIPILSVLIANVERTRIYEAVEALSNGIESADIDRERVMTELFELLQRVVNFVVADLAELHPGKEVSGFVREFFSFYNERHLGLLLDPRLAG